MVEARVTGSAPTIRATTPTVADGTAVAIAEAATAEEAATAAVVVINLTVLERATSYNAAFLERFQTYREFPGPVWNHFKTQLFPLRPALPFIIE